MKSFKYAFAFTLSFSALFLAACSSVVNSHRQKEEMMTAYLCGNAAPVEAVLEDKLKEPETFNASTVGSGDEVMWRLEAGGFYFLNGEYDRSLENFEAAETLIDDYDARAVVNVRAGLAEGAAVVVNQNVLPYRGFCRDKVLIPFYKALDYLAKGDEDGMRVELYRIREVQDKVISDYKEYFKEEDAAIEKAKNEEPASEDNVNLDKIMAADGNRDLAAAIAEAKEIGNKGYGDFLNPLTIFLSGYGYLRDGDEENAIVDFERLFMALPKNDFVRRYYASMLRKTGRMMPDDMKDLEELDFSTGHDNVLVIFANGRSAAFRQIALYIPIVFPGYYNIITAAWPVCEYYTAPFQSLSVTSDGQVRHTLTISDMDAILSQEYTDRLPGMITRLVLNVVAKEAASYLAVRAADQACSGAGIAVMITAAAYKAIFNTADTRLWEMLPKEFQVVQLPMPENRKLVLSLAGINPVEMEFSEDADSAIVYVNAPSNAASSIRYSKFELKTK